MTLLPCSGQIKSLLRILLINLIFQSSHINQRFRTIVSTEQSRKPQLEMRRSIRRISHYVSSRFHYRITRHEVIVPFFCFFSLIFSQTRAFRRNRQKFALPFSSRCPLSLSFAPSLFFLLSFPFPYPRRSILEQKCCRGTRHPRAPLFGALQHPLAAFETLHLRHYPHPRSASHHQSFQERPLAIEQDRRASENVAPCRFSSTCTKLRRHEHAERKCARNEIKENFAK